MASPTDICNRALQMLGAPPTVSLTENSKAARACNLAYDARRRRELRINNWNFAIKRARLPASSVAPLFGKANSFPKPGDWIKLLPSDPGGTLYPQTFAGVQYHTYRDWQIEGGQIYTNDSAPLNVRYIYDCQDTTLFDPCFCEALSASIALAICEALTQSNTKAQIVQSYYKDAMSEARLANALENPPATAADDDFITCRR